MPTEPQVTGPTRDVDLTQEQLEAALLTGDDLGLTENEDAAADTSDTVALEEFDANPACLDQLAHHEERQTRPLFGGGPSKAPRRALIELSGGNGGLEHEVSDGADVTIADYRELFEVCDEIRFSRSGRVGVLTFSPGPALPLGDDSLSIEYHFGSGGPTGTPVRWLLWERDSIISSISISGGDSTDPFLLEDAAEIADARLEDILP